MTMKCSEAQGRSREARSEGSVEQIRELTNRNRIQGNRIRTSEQMIAKSTVIKGYGCKSGSCAEKVVEITPGDSAVCLGNKTEETARRPDRNAEFSRGRSGSLCRASAEAGKQPMLEDEGPNGARKGLMEKVIRTPIS
jgi:hypothetical protein